MDNKEKPKGPVPLWGTCLFTKKGKERARPTWLALKMVNEVMGKDLVETVQTGAAPTFVAEGLGYTRKKAKGPGPAKTFPVLFHYAFQDGNRRALVIVSLDTSKSHPVKIDFKGTPVGGAATATLLTSEKITDDNELDSGDVAPVKAKVSKLKSFKSGAAITLPPFSMLSLEWELEK